MKELMWFLGGAIAGFALKWRIGSHTEFERGRAHERVEQRMDEQ